MKAFRSLLACAALGAALAMCVGTAGCGTGATGDPAASSPASSHFKADLVVGYRTLEAVRVGTTSALQAHIVTVTQAEAVQAQCRALTTTLDALRAAGQSTSTQTTLTATVAAISALTAFISPPQGVPKS